MIYDDDVLPVLKCLLLVCSFIFRQNLGFVQAGSADQSIQNTGKNINILSDSPFIENYSAEVFQSHNQIFFMTEDQRGVMFFGTGDGWLEFDGARFRHTSTKSRVFSMAVDRHGVVYVGLTNDFGRLLPDSQGKLVFKSLTDGLSESERKFGTTLDIRATSQGMYFNTASGPVFRWLDDRLQAIEIDVGRFVSQVGDHVFVYNDSGLYILDGTRPIALPQTQLLCCKDQDLLVLPYKDQQLLIAIQNKGFFLYSLGPERSDGGAINIDHLQESTDQRVRVFETSVTEYLQKHGLVRGIRLASGDYAFGTRQGGLVFMSPDGRRVLVIDESEGLIDNYVQDLYQDKNRNLWVATNNGISYVEINSPLSRFDDGKQTGFTLTATRYRGRLFVGGFEGAFYHAGYERQFKPEMIPVDYATSACWDMLVHQDRLILGGKFGLLAVEGTQVVDRLETKNLVFALGTSTRFPKHVFVGFPGGFSAFTFEEADPNDARIRLLDKQQGDFAKIKGEIRKIVSDPEGNLWLTDLGGQILYLRFQSDQVSDFEVYTYDQRHGLPETNYNMVHFIDGRLIIGTRGGIYEKTDQDSSQTDPASFTFALENTFGRQLNQESLRVHRIHKAQDGRIWINSYTSISTLTPQSDGGYEWNRQRFKKIKGNVEAMFFDENDVVWFTNTKGLYRYDQKIEPKGARSFRALINRVSVQNGPDIFQGVHCRTDVQSFGICKSPALQQRKNIIVELPYEDNSLIYELGATAYERPKLNRYSYKLEGYDKKWSDWTKRPRKEYTGLIEGAYTFRVRAKNIYDHLGREASYIFRILPPWYRSLWAYTAYLILFVGLFAAGFRIYAWRLLGAKRKLEKVVRQRTAEVVRQKDEIQKQLEQISLTYDVGRMEVANTVLHNVGNVLISVNVSIHAIANTAAKSIPRYIIKVAELLVERQEDSEDPLQNYPHIRKVYDMLHKIAEALDEERGLISEQTDQLSQAMGLITSIMHAQQNISRGAEQTGVIDLSRLLEDALAILKMSLDIGGVIVDMSMRKPRFIRGNRVQLTHVLINLIKNAKEAIEHNEKGNRRIEIVTDELYEVDNKFVTVRISDNGLGISRDDLERITDYGFTTKEQGQGCGLHFCKQVMQNMGGWLRVESEGLGRGASFTLLFPLSGKREASDLVR